MNESEFPYRVERVASRVAHRAIWMFRTAEEVGTFMWGRNFARYCIYKHGKLYQPKTYEVRDMAAHLDQWEPGAMPDHPVFEEP